ncbi:tetratricopeptide repeat protein [Leisingera sp. S232]|uniref:tetratricopeptide repeat protein n=1 Tax=Leisingera sp. S232 TaxID=3415132 RepID=UPI00086C49B2|nr:hypothetical protein AB838_05825 [Rhodobacteraceae bacterium (ex Bugula neritina AB1)]
MEVIASQTAFGRIARTNTGRCFAVAALAAALGLAACATPNSNFTSVSSQIHVAEQFVKNGEYGQGHGIYDQVAERNSRSKQAFLELGDSYFRINTFLKAETSYRKAIALGAQEEGYIGLGRVELVQNKPRDAENAFRAALQKNPANLDAKNGLAVAFDLQRQHGKAQEIYREILIQEPGHTKTLNNFALSMTLNGSPSLSKPLFAALARSNPDNETIRQNLAISQYLSGEHQQAQRTATVDLSAAEAKENFRLLSRALVIAR